MPLRGDSEEKGRYPVGNPSWGVSVENHRLSSLVLWFWVVEEEEEEEMSLLGWLEVQEGCEKHIFSCEEHLFIDLHPIGWKEVCFNSFWVSCNLLSAPQPKPSECSSPARSTSQCGTGLLVAETRKRTQPWAMEMAQSWSRAYMAGSGHCWHLLKQLLRRSPDL